MPKPKTTFDAEAFQRGSVRRVRRVEVEPDEAAVEADESESDASGTTTD